MDDNIQVSSLDDDGDDIRDESNLHFSKDNKTDSPATHASSGGESMFQSTGNERLDQDLMELTTAYELTSGNKSEKGEHCFCLSIPIFPNDPETGCTQCDFLDLQLRVPPNYPEEAPIVFLPESKYLEGIPLGKDRSIPIPLYETDAGPYYRRIVSLSRVIDKIYTWLENSFHGPHAIQIRDFYYHISDPRHWGRPFISAEDVRMAAEAKAAAAEAQRQEEEAGFMTNSLDPGALAKALYDFTAELDAEMGLNEGDVVRVVRRDGNGWVLATLVQPNKTTNRRTEGLVPENYIEALPVSLFNDDEDDLSAVRGSPSRVFA